MRICCCHARLHKTLGGVLHKPIGDQGHEWMDGRALRGDSAWKNTSTKQHLCLLVLYMAPVAILSSRHGHMIVFMKIKRGESYCSHNKMQSGLQKSILKEEDRT